ncbi:cation transporter [Tumebacillus avium]|uniref:Cation transporter n=1 Tax=Tumebacillus avium TaxID=1903704 RepID=A0A1Y0IMS8_9BACL|nr:cation diffusion facilitator family transporter [Tumebacillus avium]ARU61359.1 cation transporter [Tumebacillus avium]
MGHHHDHHHHDHHDHEHHHGHGHHHHHGDGSRKSLTFALIITGGVFAAELAGGILTNSLALLSDAAHMFSDVAALAISLIALWLMAKPATLKRTFGLKRAEVLAALFNAVTLIVVALYIFWEAAQRFQHPPEVQSGLMLGVAFVGLAANLLSAWFLMRGGDHKHNLNVRGALLHVLGDALGSVGAIGAAVIMMLTGWYYADPLISVIIGVLVLLSSLRLLKETISVLLEAVPAHLDLTKIKHAMQGVAHVEEVYDLHVWTVSSGFLSMSGHVVIDSDANSDDVLRSLEEVLSHQFGLTHTTIQIERENRSAGNGVCQ